MRIICGRLCLSSKTRWGITSKGLQKYTFKPRNHSYPTYIVSSKLKPSQIDVYAKVEIQEWTQNASHPNGSLVEIIGDVTDASLYENVIIKSHQVLPRNRNTVHRSETKHFSIQDTPPHSTIDEDWTSIPTISIDPKGSLDIDDAISVKIHNNDIEYAVHIQNTNTLV